MDQGPINCTTHLITFQMFINCLSIKVLNYNGVPNLIQCLEPGYNRVTSAVWYNSPQVWPGVIHSIDITMCLFLYIALSLFFINKTLQYFGLSLPMVWRHSTCIYTLPFKFATIHVYNIIVAIIVNCHGGD